MTIYHKHCVFLTPNSFTAQRYAEQIRANVERCKVKESTIGISVEWEEVAAVTESEEES